MCIDICIKICYNTSVYNNERIIMKTFIRKDGRKFNISNALYEEIRKKGLFEDGYNVTGSLTPSYTVTYNFSNNIGKDTSDEQPSTEQPSTEQPSTEQPSPKKPRKIPEKVLAFNTQLEKYNEIVELLGFLEKTNNDLVGKGERNHPFCYVYRSDKFRRNFIGPWLRIAKALKQKDPKDWSDTQKKELASIGWSDDYEKNKQLVIKDIMVKQLKKKYNI